MIVSCYFVRYFERSMKYKFYDPTKKSLIEIRNDYFFEDAEFGRGAKF